MRATTFTLGLAFFAARSFSAEPNNRVVDSGYFQTLVNPACSHCADEAKRRAGDLRDDDRVLAWIRGKYDGGAVPFRFFLVPYRVISDTYGVWVYDADAGFVRGYEPSLDFTFHGWRHGVMTLRHKDGTLFSALSGVAFDGPRKGESLKPLPTIETGWGYWLKAYPRTVAYHMFEKYAPHELPHGESEGSAATRLPPDRRLPADEKVIGLALGGVAKAWPISILSREKIIRDKIGDREVAVLWFEPTKTAAIYAPRMDSEKIPAHLTLTDKPQTPAAPFMDEETFSHWTIEGRALEGPLKGKTLEWLPGVQCKWFAWAAEYPATGIFSETKRAEISKTPVIAKLIEGERLDWQSLAKTKARIVNMNAKSVTLAADSDDQEHTIALTPHTEFYAHGAWGEAADFQPGQRVFVIATTAEKTKWIAAHALADEISWQALSPSREMDAAFKTERDARMKKYRDSAAANGLVATVQALEDHSLVLLVRRADAWFARSMKTGDTVRLHAAGTTDSKTFPVVEVRPDYARVRVRLALPDSTVLELHPGDEVRLLAPIPEKIDYGTPPDLGRFTARQDRIDWFLSTIYCPCGMKGGSCAGHWNTLAACQLHGCGMPNVITLLIGEWIDAGKSDQEILAAVIEREGKLIWQQHQEWADEKPKAAAR